MNELELIKKEVAYLRERIERVPLDHPAVAQAQLRRLAGALNHAAQRFQALLEELP